jgi:rubrerythrin
MITLNKHAEFIEQLHKELDAYCKYKELLEVSDDHLKSALKEIMWDEYLHAKFLRKHLMKIGAYSPEEFAEIEKKYIKVENDL